MNQTLFKKCEKHPNFDLCFASINQNCNQMLLCQICILKEKFDAKYLISIHEAILQSSCPIQNWPLGVDQHIIDCLSQKNSIKKKEQIRIDIEGFYTELKYEVSKLIDDSQEKSLEQLDKCISFQQDFIEFYNESFQRNELSKILSNLNQFDQKEYLKLLSEVELTKSTHIQELAQRIKIMEDIELQLSRGQCQQIKQVINQLVKKIDIFSLSPNNQNKNIFNQSTYDEQSQINLTSSITNIVVESLSNHNSLISTIGQIQSKIYFENHTKQEKFNIFNQDQCDYASNQSDILKKELFKPVTSIFDAQENQQGILNPSQKNEASNLKQVINQSEVKQIKEQQLQPNIKFEDKIENKNEKENEQFLSNELKQLNNTSEVMQFKKPKFYECNMIKVETDNKNKNIVISYNFINKIVGQAMVYSNFILKRNKSYTIRFKSNKPFYQFNNEIQIGLMQSHKLEELIIEYQKFFDDYNLTKSQLVKGTLLQNSQNKEKIIEIEMRVNLDQDYISYSDYPNYENIFRSKQKHGEYNYRFVLGFLIGGKNHIIQITYFEVSDNFIGFN